MPRCGAHSMKITSPLGQGGTSGGFERGNKPIPALRDRCRCDEGDFHVIPAKRSASWNPVIQGTTIWMAGVQV